MRAIVRVITQAETPEPNVFEWVVNIQEYGRISRVTDSLEALEALNQATRITIDNIRMRE